MVNLRAFVLVWLPVAAGSFFGVNGQAQDPGLSAGFAKVDITPPPGVRMFGYWDESRVSRGFRTRLYARAMVLEDGRGQKLAIVVVDLGAVSASLHRSVASSVRDQTGISADRLVLAATGTHSGPGHFFSAGLFNRVSADRLDDRRPPPSPRSYFLAPFRRPVTLFDSELEGALVAGISEAVREADDARARGPARAMWGRRVVSGVATGRLSEEVEASVLTMLRVDVRTDGVWSAAGALSIFGMHGSGYPLVNDLLDGDIQGRVSWLVEREAMAPDGLPFVHLMANGTLGDVSPEATRDRGSLCGVSTLARSFSPQGPHQAPPVDLWTPPVAELAEACLAAARREVDDAAAILAESVSDLLTTLGATITEVDGSAGSMSVARSFRTMRLASASGGGQSLCRVASLGVPFVLGPVDGRSRYADFRRLGVRAPRYGGSTLGGAADPCQGGREVLQWSIEQPPGLYPDQAQLQVLRIGTMLVGVTPAAVTRAAGQGMTTAMADQANDMGLASDPAGPVLIGLANGYMLYAPTPAEYADQSYEGAATLYGVNTATVLSDRLRELVEDYGATGTPNPDPDVSELTVLDKGELWTQVSVSSDMWSELEANSSSIRDQSRATCEVDVSDAGGRLVFRWRDAHPGALMPSQGTLVRIDALGQSVGDDDPALEVRVSVDQGVAAQNWEAVWIMPGPVEGAITVTVPARTIGPQGVTVPLPEIVRDCLVVG